MRTPILEYDYYYAYVYSPKDFRTQFTIHSVGIGAMYPVFGNHYDVLE